MALLGIPGRVIDTITKKLGLQTAVERSTFELAQTIQPIINADEKEVNIVKRVNDNATIYTVPPKSEFLLSSVQVSAVDILSASNSNCEVTIVMPTGETVILFRDFFGTTGGTDQTLAIHHTYPIPIKLTAGAAIIFAKGGDEASCSITGVESSI